MEMSEIKRLARQLAKHGRFGDKHLLHVNDTELEALKKKGLLHINPVTGLPEAWNPTHGDFSIHGGAGDVAEALFIPPATAVGGVSGGNIAKNVISGDDPFKHATGAAALDLAGLGAGFALGPTGLGAKLWGTGAAAGGAEAGAGAAPYYAGADAEAFASGISPETGEAMNLGAEELGIPGTDVIASGGDAGGAPIAGPGAATNTGAGAPTVAGTLGNAALRFGPLALGVGGIAYQRAQANKYSKQLAGIGAPQRAAGESLIAQYQSGQLNAADKYQIDTWEQGAIAQAKNYYAKAGLSDSSMAKNAETEIHSKAAAMKQEALNNLLTMGTNILNTTDQYQRMAIQAQASGDQNLFNQSVMFLNSYGAWLRNIRQQKAA